MHHHAMEPSPLSNLSRLVPASETREMCRVRKGWSNRDSCFVDWPARSRGETVEHFRAASSANHSLTSAISAPAFPTSWLRISCSLSMPRPSPSPPTQTHALSLARSAGNDFLLVYFDGFFNLTSDADGRTDGPSSRSPPPAQPTTTGETQLGPSHAQRQRMPPPTGPIQ